MASFGNLRSNRCNRHFEDVVLSATIDWIVSDADSSTNAASDNDAHALIIAKIAQSRIGQSLFCCLNAEF